MKTLALFTVVLFVGCAENPVEPPPAPRDITGNWLLVYYTPQSTISGSVELVRTGDTITGTLEIQSVRYELAGVAHSDTLYQISCFNGAWGYNLALKHRNNDELIGPMEMMQQIGVTRQSRGMYSCVAIKR